MRELVFFSALVGSIMCALAGAMIVLGLGSPNCSATLAGYAEWWLMLFGSSALAVWLMALVACVVKFSVDLFFKGGK